MANCNTCTQCGNACDCSGGGNPLCVLCDGEEAPVTEEPQPDAITIVNRQTPITWSNPPFATTSNITIGTSTVGHWIVQPPKRKVMVVTGSRAEYSRVRSVLKAIVAHPDLELQLVVMGGHLLEQQGNTIEEIEKDGFPIYAQCDNVVEGRTPSAMAISTGLGITLLSQIYAQGRPHVLVAPTDTYAVLAAAIAAALMNIPIAHIQGGELSGTIDESIRHAITKLAHIHFPATPAAADRIIRMGENLDCVFMVGCPGTDALLVDSAEIHWQPVDPYMIFLQHPVTTEFGQFRDQWRMSWDAISKVAIEHECRIVPFLPNTDAGSLANLPGQPLANVNHKEFVQLMAQAKVMVGNSSAAIREACYFGTPVVDIGTRQQGRERGKHVTHSPYNMEEIKWCINAQWDHGRYTPEQLYGDGTAGEQIADILADINLDGILEKVFYE